VQGSDGVWRQQLPAMPAGGPYNLTFSSSTGGSASMSDVLFGDVYLCGGQSNMEFTVASALNASAEIAAANYPWIRVFTVGQGNSSNTPFVDLASVEQTWTAATPASIGGPDWHEFSAMYDGDGDGCRSSPTVPISRDVCRLRVQLLLLRP
jgi:sialate O-acetylesterase